MVNLPESVASEFEGVELGDSRLSKRCQQLALKIAGNPSASLPKALVDWAETKAAYRFLSNDKVTRDSLLEPHIEQTVDRIAGQPLILAIQDTTTLELTRLDPIDGLGFTGTSLRTRGMLVHTTLAVGAESREVLGVLNQETWIRPTANHRGETQKERMTRPRESECWARGVAGVARLGLEAKVLAVFDREGDVFEALEALDRSGQDFVIRACRNRKISNEAGYVFDAIQQAPALGKYEVEVPPRAGRSGRTASLAVRSASMTMLPPKIRQRKGEAFGVGVGVVQAIETNPPAGVEALNWILLTRQPIGALDDCIRVLKFYACRWKIEEFHMALKTGCRIEERQLQTRAGFEALLGIFSVISVMLLRLRDEARQEDPRLASEILNAVQMKILSSKVRRFPSNPTARDALRAIAMMGGFLGRKGDGEPGWRTLWSGMCELMLMEKGYLLALGNPTIGELE